jgi:hypothetical protein
MTRKAQAFTLSRKRTKAWTQKEEPRRLSQAFWVEQKLP